MSNKKLREEHIDNVELYPEILNLFEDEEEMVEEIKYFKKDKKLEPFSYLTKKQFSELRDLSNVKVIGNVRMKDKFKHDDDKDTKEKNRKKLSKIIGCVQFPYSEDYIEKHPNKEYNETMTYEANLYKPRDVSCIGYAYVGESNFVRIENDHYFIILLIISLLIASIIFGLTLIPNIELPHNNNVDYENGYESDYEFENDYEKYVQMDFSSYYRLTKDNPTLPIGNPERNQYLMQVDVYLVKTDDVDKSDSLTSVKNSRGEKILFFDTNKNKKYDEGESTLDKKVYSTKYIKPGSAPARINLWEILDKGRYHLAFDISFSALDGSDIASIQGEKYQITTGGFQAVTTVVDIVK